MWRSQVARVALVGLLAVTSGCWLQTGFTASRRAFNDLETTVTAANVADLVTRWTAPVDGPATESVIDQGLAVVPGARDITALGLGSGAERWSGCCGGRGPAVIAGPLRAATGGADHCRMMSLDLATGASTELGAFGPELPDFFSRGCEPGDVLAVGTRAIAPWFVVVGPVPAGPPGPCNAGQNLWLIGPGISALDVGTAALWEHSAVQGICTVSSTAPPVSDVGPLSSDGSSVFFPRDLTLNALPLECTVTGCPTSWSVNIAPAVGAGATIVGPAVVLAGGDLALATSDGHVVVVDGASHQVAWTATLAAPLDQPLAADDTTTFAATTDGTIAALPAGGCGAATCEPAWTAVSGSPASARPSIGGDVLYVGGADGTVTALPASGCGAPTCAGLWTGTTPSRITGAPAVVAGTIVVGSADGTVTAFGLPA